MRAASSTGAARARWTSRRARYCSASPPPPCGGADMDAGRIRHAGLRARLAGAAEAAAHIRPGDTVAMSGFTGAGYPKAVPQALAARMEAAASAGEPFRVKVLTGASTAPELDGALAKVRGMELRLPYQSDPTVRARINAGELDYIDIHLSHVAQHAWFGFFGPIDVALVEATATRDD